MLQLLDCLSGFRIRWTRLQGRVAAGLVEGEGEGEGEGESSEREQQRVQGEG